MNYTIIAVYCVCADLLKGLHHQEDKQCRMSDAEIMTIGIVAMLYFGGNYERSRCFMKEQGYMPCMLSASRFSRRLHAIRPLFLTLFAVLGEEFKAMNPESIYAIDSFPLACCDNYRIPRCRLYQGEAYRGYKPSKRRYWYGLKLHLMVTQAGAPVEFFFTPAACSDTTALEDFDFDLPDNAFIVADKAYNYYLIEDNLADVDIVLAPLRKSNSKRPIKPWQRYLRQAYRKTIETTGSALERLLPKSIHATSQAGFELKAVLFVLALSFTYA